MSELALLSMEDRTVRGLLVPWDEESRVATDGKGGTVKPMKFKRGALAVPSDIAVLGLNRHHKREDPVGRFTDIEDTDKGLIVTLSVARTPEGDQVLADLAKPAEGRELGKLSAELRNIRRNPANPTEVAYAELFGGALVTEGAFKTAAVYASLAETESSSESVEEYTDADGVTWVRKYSSKTTSEGDDADRTVTTVTTVTEQRTEAAAEADTPNQEEPPMETATLAAAGTAATIPGAAPAGQTRKAATLHDVANALFQYAKFKDNTALLALAEEDRRAGEMAFAAIGTIESTSADSIGETVLQPQWLGALWGTKAHQRRIVPLLDTAPLTSFKITGYTWDDLPEGGDWAGDLAEIDSNDPTVVPKEWNAARWAGGHKIARELVDFPNPEVLAAYMQHMANSYSRWSDAKALAAIVAASTAVTAGAVPAGVNAATVLLVDGALAVYATEETAPSFALCSSDVFRSLLLQGKDDLIATLSMSLNLEAGDLEGFRIQPVASFAANTVLVGAKPAATFHELPGASPIRTEALDIHHGGIDKGFFGYAATRINLASGLVKVTPAP